MNRYELSQMRHKPVPNMSWGVSEIKSRTRECHPEEGVRLEVFNFSDDNFTCYGFYNGKWVYGGVSSYKSFDSARVGIETVYMGGFLEDLQEING